MEGTVDLVNSVNVEEFQIVARQTGILIDRYNLKTHVVERFCDTKHQHNGISEIKENVPESVVESGMLSVDSVDAFRQFYQRMQQGLPAGSVDVRMQDTLGEYRWFHGDYTLVYGKDDIPDYAIITFVDNTRKREMELASEKWRVNLASILSESILYAEVNLTKNVIDKQEGAEVYKRASHAADTLEAFVNYGAGHFLISGSAEDYYEFFDRKRLIGLFYENVYEDNFDYCIDNQENGNLWIRANIRTMKYPYSDDVMAIIAYLNIDKQRREVEQLTRLANQDALTGIFNRNGIEKQIQKMLSSFQPPDTLALFMIDLDNFKQVNDRLGHQDGDAALKQAAEILRHYFSQSDIVGRLGGDEFVVFISGRMGQQNLIEKAWGLLHALHFKIGGKKCIHISASIGIAFGQGKISFEKLYRKADIALYTSKRAGKSRFHLIDTDTEQEISYPGDKEELAYIMQEDMDDDAMLFKVGNRKDKSPYEALVETIPGGVAIIEFVSSSQEVQITHCNNWICQFTGYSKAEVDMNHKKGFLSGVCNDDYSILLKAVSDVKNGEDYFNVSFRLHHKEGTFKYVNLSASVSERKPNKIIMHGVYIDLNKAIRMQKELDKSHMSLEGIISALPGGIAIYEIGKKFKVTHCNEWIYQYTGYTREEVMQTYQDNMLGMIHEEDRGYVKKAIKKAMEGDAFLHISFRLVHKNGEAKHTNVNATVIEQTESLVTMYGLYYE